MSTNFVYGHFVSINVGVQVTLYAQLQFGRTRP